MADTAAHTIDTDDAEGAAHYEALLSEAMADVAAALADGRI